MLGEIDLPAEKGMIKEISEFLAWNRMRYQGLGERYPLALFDWIGYVDRLLGDLGVKARRKSNFIKELIEPYGPDTYAGYSEEYRRKRSGKKGSLRSNDS